MVKNRIGNINYQPPPHKVGNRMDMINFEFYDLDKNRIRVQNSSSAREAYRVYVATMVAGRIDEDTEMCLHLTKNQAEILVNALQDLFYDND